MHAPTQAPPVRGARLPYGPLTFDGADLALFAAAVEPLGRRAPDMPVVDAELVRAAGTVVLALDHAGPAAALWSPDRAVGPDGAPEVRTGRTPRALDDAGWEAVTRAYASAAELAARGGVRCALVVDDDGLLHAALRADPSARARVLAIHAACGGVDVILAVEDLAPGGRDATDGIADARALVAQGAKRIYAGAGTASLPALRRREKGTTTGVAAHLASAAWLVGRVDAEIVAVVPHGDVDALGRAAAALGLRGVVVERP